MLGLRGLLGTFSAFAIRIFFRFVKLKDILIKFLLQRF